MGIFRHPVAIGLGREGPWETLQAVVNTGSLYCWVPASLLAQLGIIPLERRPFETADGRVIEREAGEVVARINGRTRVTLVVFGNEGTEPVLGAYTLEGFGLGVDPVHRRLVPILGRV